MDDAACTRAILATIGVVHIAAGVVYLVMAARTLPATPMPCICPIKKTLEALTTR